MIYFLQDPADGSIKIGFSRDGDPEKRRSDLQTGNPRRLTILGVIDGDRGHECEFHKRFAEHRTDGGREWFSAKIIDEVNELLGLPPLEPLSVAAEIRRRGGCFKEIIGLMTKTHEKTYRIGGLCWDEQTFLWIIADPSTITWDVSYGQNCQMAELSVLIEPWPLTCCQHTMTEWDAVNSSYDALFKKRVEALMKKHPNWETEDFIMFFARERKRYPAKIPASSCKAPVFVPRKEFL